MYTRYPLTESRLDTIKKCTEISISDVLPIIANLHIVNDEFAQHELSYRTVNNVLSGTFNSRIALSGDVVTYGTLKNAVFYGINNLFASCHATYIHEQAIKMLSVKLSKEYADKIALAIINGKNYINLKKADTIIKLYRKCVHRALDDITDNNILPIATEVLHDLFVFFLDNGISISSLAMPYDEYKTRFNAVYHSTSIEKVRKGDNIYVLDGVIYKVTEDGKTKVHRRMKSHTFSCMPYVNTDKVTAYQHGTSYRDTFYQFTTPWNVSDHIVDEDSKYYYVQRYYSIADKAMRMCDTFIEKEKRSYTSNQSYDTAHDENGIDLPYIEQYLIDIVCTDTFIALCDKFCSLGMKYSTANKFVKVMLLKQDGYTYNDACRIVEISVQHMKRLRTAYLPAISDYYREFC